MKYMTTGARHDLNDAIQTGFYHRTDSAIDGIAYIIKTVKPDITRDAFVKIHVEFQRSQRATMEFLDRVLVRCSESEHILNMIFQEDFMPLEEDKALLLKDRLGFIFDVLIIADKTFIPIIMCSNAAHIKIMQMFNITNIDLLRKYSYLFSPQYLDTISRLHCVPSPIKHVDDPYIIRVADIMYAGNPKTPDFMTCVISVTYSATKDYLWEHRKFLWELTRNTLALRKPFIDSPGLIQHIKPAKFVFRKGEVHVIVEWRESFAYEHIIS